jgi:hypothetical protein
VALAAAATLAAICALGWSLARAREARAEAYARERAAQRRAAVAARAVETPPIPAAPVKTPCVTGVDGFAVAVERALTPWPEGPAPRARRVAALKQISAEAVRAEKLAELARPAPTLPKRMGLANGEPVAPVKPACDGRGYAELQ